MERAETLIEVLLNEPEILAWLEVSEREIAAWRERREERDDDGERATAA